MFDARDGGPAVSVGPEELQRLGGLVLDVAYGDGHTAIVDGTLKIAKCDAYSVTEHERKLSRRISEWAQKVSAALGGKPGEFNLTPDQAMEKIRELAEAKEARDSKWCWRIGNALGLVNPSIESAESAIVTLCTELAEAESRSLASGAMLEVVNGDLRWVEGETLPQAHRDLAKANEDLAKASEKVEALEAELAKAKASPSLPEPDASSPEQCRFVSEVSRRLEPEVADGYADWERGLTAREWGQRADRLEREQAVKTAQDHAIEQAAQVLIWPQQGITWDAANGPQRKDARVVAGHLAKAGLLNTKHGEA